MTIIEGTGTLRAGGREVGSVHYRIHIANSDATESARGTFLGDPSVLYPSIMAREMTLLRDDNGHEMAVTLTSVNGDGSGTLTVSGSLGPVM